MGSAASDVRINEGNLYVLAAFWLGETAIQAMKAGDGWEEAHSNEHIVEAAYEQDGCVSQASD